MELHLKFEGQAKAVKISPSGREEVSLVTADYPACVALMKTIEQIVPTSSISVCDDMDGIYVYLVDKNGRTLTAEADCGMPYSCDANGGLPVLPTAVHDELEAIANLL